MSQADDPSTGSTLRDSPDERIERLCEEFVREWTGPDFPRIETWLARVAMHDRHFLLSRLIGIEVRLRTERGEPVEMAEYVLRFPGEDDPIVEGFRWASQQRTSVPDGSTREGSDATTTRETAPRPTRFATGDVYGRRYEIRRLLGRGAFSEVYLAHDTKLRRLVALKMPSLRLIGTSRQVATFLAEARSSARLYHDAIVQIHDVHRHGGQVAIVQQFIDGPTLAELARSVTPLSVEQIVRLLVRVAEAVDFAHRRGFIHRDLKPANILIDDQGRPHVADFGLALHRNDREVHAGELAGTYAYMSPEQVRREVHRLDERSDVWGLGVILYELLSGGRRPFDREPPAALLRAIEHDDPPVLGNVPAELSRVCLKCLAKRATSRYVSAAELAADLEHWLAGSTVQGSAGLASNPAGDPGQASSTAVARAGASAAAESVVVPKGLRSFDASDADFYLELVPGPRDRDGLPEGLRFWKQAIEAVEAPDAFAVGLMYGPSGCGKSSLVKAGLLPRLGEHVRVVHVEATATPTQTEARILRELRRKVHDVPPHLGLRSALETIRDLAAPGRKVLLVIDHFEQWLHGWDGDDDAELVRALRQCDGERVQTLLLVRDDFWMSITRFMQCLEVPQVEGRNAMAVDLFDRDHACRVLTAFGRSLKRIDTPPTAEQQQFVQQAVAELGPDGKVVCVQLALFAEMMRGREWTTAGLRAVGGAAGVGVTFLEETFGGRSAPLSYRVHEAAAREVLSALLPGPGTDIRGRMRSHDELLRLSGYEQRRRDFDTLIEILSREVRLITPTEPTGPPTVVGGEAPSEAASRFYQLTHDYLVPSIRDWLTRGQRSTRRGRASLVLDERSNLWGGRPEARQLPTWWEWGQIRTLTSPAQWSEPQKRMMRAANRRHVSRTIAWIGLVAGLFAVAALVRSQAERQAHARHTDELVARLWSNEPRFLPEVLDELERDPASWRPRVERAATEPTGALGTRARAQVALARIGTGELDAAVARLLEAGPEEGQFLGNELRRDGDRAVPLLRQRLADASLNDRARLRAADVLATLAPDDPVWEGEAATTVVRALVGSNLLELGQHVEALTPVDRKLRAPLMAALDDPSLVLNDRLVAANALTGFAARDQGLLTPVERVDLVTGHDPSVFAGLFPLLPPTRDAVVPLLRRRVAEADRNPGNGLGRNAQRAAAAMALARLAGPADFWPHLAAADEPGLRTRLMADMAQSQVAWRVAADRLGVEPDPGIRQGILIGLDSYAPQLRDHERDELANRVAAIFEADPDPGVHAAAEWVLRRLGQTQQVDHIVARLAGSSRGPRGWYINTQGQTFVVFAPPGRFTVGSPRSERGHDPSEAQHEVVIDDPFAIGMHLVTIGQYQRSNPIGIYNPEITPTADCPAAYVSWFDAATYCRWLGQQPGENVSESQQPYPPSELTIDREQPLPHERLERLGYRLPTSEEWEYAARAGTRTARFFGDDDHDLDRHAWWAGNSLERTWPVGLVPPNPAGLFDVFGNVWQWCDPSDDEPLRTGPPLHGGGYRGTPKFLRAARVERFWSKDPLSNVGFRLARTLPPADGES
jgi:formylglycine-generating enzyme required for sulfatase activity